MTMTIDHDPKLGVKIKKHSENADISMTVTIDHDPKLVKCLSQEGLNQQSGYFRLRKSDSSCQLANQQ